MTSLAKTFRLTVLLVLLGATIITCLVNGNIDPRFYRFLNSGQGRAVAGIMGWSVDFEFLPADKPEVLMTAEEVGEKRRLENVILEGAPKHRLVLRSGDVLKGEVLGEDGYGVVTFLQSFGDSGTFRSKIPEQRILRIEEHDRDMASVTYRDVRFSMEFPDLNFYSRPPYTVVTDQNYLQVERAVKDLQRLHYDFVRLFGSLITLPDRGEGIQLLFFQDEERYRSYQRGYAPQLEHTAGFYSPKLDRFVVFNQATAQQNNPGSFFLAKTRAFRRSSDTTHGRAGDSPVVGRSLKHHAEEQTRMTVRHEGAHQLFFTYGIHSRHHAENSWLIEGLASYYETAPPGGPQPKRRELLKSSLRDHNLIPLADLVNSRSPRGLYAFWGDRRVHLAYAQSWALVSFLMREQHRERFFDYLRYVRDPANIDELAGTPRIDLLAQSLGLKTDELEKRWDHYLGSI
jgi:hypothetical protein